MSEYLSILEAVDSWPRALVVIAVVAGGVFLRKQVKEVRVASDSAGAAASVAAEVKTTLTQNNGGGSVKDALDRIEARQREQAARQEEQGNAIDTVTAVLTAHLAEVGTSESDDEEPPAGDEEDDDA